MKNFWSIRIGKHRLGDLTFHLVNGIVMLFVVVVMLYLLEYHSGVLQ